MRVLAFRHIPMEHLGLIADALETAGAKYQYVDLYRDPAGPVDLKDVAGLIFLGGPMSANDDFGYLRRELGIIDSALVTGTPILGMCLGAQLIAKSLGAEVRRNPVKEIGWGAIHRTDAGHRDPVLGSLRDPETVLHWHGETFDLPTAATWLAFSDECRHQAFRYGGNVYGLQFHLEVTPEMIEEWLRAEINQNDLRDLGRPIDPYAHCERMEELSTHVFGAWARLVAEHGLATRR
jgi:GMP synthase (glutamine-hydrolysing)